MALTQPTSQAVWPEQKGSGAALSMGAMQLVDDGNGGWTFAAVSLGAPVGARLLANVVRGGFDVSDGPANPTSADELHLLDIGGGNIITYE